MTVYEWGIRNDVGHSNPSLRILNDVLRKSGGLARVEQTALSKRLIIEIGDAGSSVGRPNLQPVEDLTVDQIYHARFMNVPMTHIAKSMGISVRTLHRRWRKAMESHISPDTPYSQWP